MNGKPQIKILCLLLITLVLEWFARPLLAQPSSRTAPPSRYLIILDTSYAMRRRAPAVQKAVENFLHSGMAVQLRPDDTIGVWTYDEQLYAGVFPLQLWTPQRSEIVASNIVAFVKSQSYQKRTSNFEVVVPALIRVARDSYRLTVLVVSDGNESFPGLPFDQQIQEAFAGQYKKQERARMPFITVLRCFRGEFCSATVNLAPWPVEFPAFPPEPPVVQAPPPPAPAPKPTPRAEAPPLIVSGKKPEPTPATNAPVERDPAVAVPSPVPVEPANALPPVKPEPASVSASSAIPTNAHANPTVQVPVVGTETPTPPPADLSATPSAPTTPATTTAPVTVSGPSALSPAVMEPITSPVETVAAPSAPATNKVLNLSKPAVTAPLVASAKPEPSLSGSPASPKSSGQESAALATVPPPETVGVTPSGDERSSPITNAPAGVALAVQTEPGFNRMGLVAIGVAMLVLAVALLLVIRRRAHQTGRASLITHSMGRDKD